MHTSRGLATCILSLLLLLPARPPACLPACLPVGCLLLQGIRMCKYLFPPLVWLVDRTPGLRGRGLGLRLPSPLLRYITFKLTQVCEWGEWCVVTAKVARAGGWVADWKEEPGRSEQS